MNDINPVLWDSDSPTSTESGTMVPTPSASRANSISQSSSTYVPPGPLDLTTLSTSSWRQPYPSIGQFAMTESDEVVAAGPNGLFYFRRIKDHDTQPWSEPRPFPSVQATLNESTVSGLALYSGRNSKGPDLLYLYCVSGGVLYSFYLIDKNHSSFIQGPSPLALYKVTGNPAVVRSSHSYSSYDQWSLVVACQSGGLLHTSATNSPSYNKSVSTRWEAVDHLATDLGIISAVSIVAIDKSSTFSDGEIELVAVCISRGQLHVVQGSFINQRKWEGKTSTRILHPGGVTGNPVLIANHVRAHQLDLLVPSAEGGIFHFVRTQSAPNDWHMIGRVAFPQNIPPASCLSFNSRFATHGTHELYALVQICGRLYHVKTTSNILPWHNSRLNPIEQPGPFFK